MSEVYKCEYNGCDSTTFHVIDGKYLQCQQCGGTQHKVRVEDNVKEINQLAVK